MHAGVQVQVGRETVVPRRLNGRALIQQERLVGRLV